MRKLFFLLIVCTIPLYSCDDGDVITLELDFEDTYSICEGISNAVLYKTKEDPSESLRILISGLTLEDLLAVAENDSLEIIKSSTLYYRTYSNKSLPSDLFCNDIQPANVKITKHEESDVTATFSTILIEDDNDGIPAKLEDRDGDGNYKNDDTDGDGLADYIDEDDDGDNVPTADENPDPNGDGNLDDAQDTDGDGIPDYLDKDDDGDGVLTRDEENETQDHNPQNDETFIDTKPDYLNELVKDYKFPATVFRSHTYTQTYVVSLKLAGISLDFLSMEELDFGALENSAVSNIKTFTPDFVEYPN